MFFKRKSKSKRKNNSSTQKEENAPIIQYDLLFSKDGIDVKEKGVFLSQFPNKTEPNRTVYELMSLSLIHIYSSPPPSTENR